ncbi:MAG: helix-turn-helix domain-containing protein [Steroidobacteraceae bacterium]
METHSSEQITQAIAEELRAAWARKNITKDELADLSGVSRSVVFRTLNGEREAKMSQLIALCEALGVEPSVLLQAALNAVRAKNGSGQTDQ